MDKGKKIDVPRLRSMLRNDPTRKKQLQQELDISRHTLSNMLHGKRQIYAGELLTIADVLGVNPNELAA